MKKLIFLTVFIIMAGAIFGQTLQKGNLLGVHVVDLKLKPDVTYNQWKDFMLNKFIPKFKEVTQGEIELYLIEGSRGENENGIGIIYFFKSVAARDKYFNTDGSISDYGQQAFDKLNTINQEATEKFEKSFITKYTDWIVQ